MPCTDISITSSQRSHYLYQTLSSWLFQSSKSCQWCNHDMRTWRSHGKKRTGQLKHMHHDNMYDKLMINKHKNVCWYLVERWWCCWPKVIAVIRWQGAYARGRGKRFTEERCILWLICLLHIFIHLLARWHAFQLMHTFQALICDRGSPQGTDHLS